MIISKERFLKNPTAHKKDILDFGGGREGVRTIVIFEGKTYIGSMSEIDCLESVREYEVLPKGTPFISAYWWSEHDCGADSGYFKYKVLDTQKWQSGFEDEWLQKCRIH